MQTDRHPLTGQPIFKIKRRKQLRNRKYHKRRVFDAVREYEIKERCLQLAGEVRHVPAPWCKPLPNLTRLRELIECDFSTGVVRAKVQRPRLQPGDILGTLTNGYLQIYIDGLPYRLHRLVWKLFHGTDPNGHIDHIDGNRSNNAITNLRDVLPVENSRNRSARCRNSSGRRGVCWCNRTGLWTAHASYNNRVVCLGKYESMDCAIAARQCAEEHLYGLSPKAQEAA